MWAFVVLWLGALVFAATRIHLRDHSKLHDRGVLIALVFVFAVLWLAAIVVWRQRWAWWLSLVGDLVAVARGPIAGAAPYVLTIATLALLVSPGVRRHVGIRLPFQRTERNATS